MRIVYFASGITLLAISLKAGPILTFSPIAASGSGEFLGFEDTSVITGLVLSGSNAEGESFSVSGSGGPGAPARFVACFSPGPVGSLNCSFSVNGPGAAAFGLTFPSPPGFASFQNADWEYNANGSTEITFTGELLLNPLAPSSVIIPLSIFVAVGPTTEICFDGGSPPFCGGLPGPCGSSFNGCELVTPITISPAGVPEPATTILPFAGLVYFAIKTRRRSGSRKSPPTQPGRQFAQFV